MSTRARVFRAANYGFWVAVACAAAFVLYTARDAQRRVETMELAVHAERQQGSDALAAAYRAAAQRVELPKQLTRLDSNGPSPSALPIGTKLIAVFAENACGECVDRELAFVSRMTKAATRGHVVTAVVASQLRYAEALRRRMGDNAVVYWDPEAQLPASLGIEEEQLLALVNGDERLIALHLPVSGGVGLANAFHDAAHRELTRGVSSDSELREVSR